MKSPQSERIHYLDNLRALAMLLGIFFHAAIAYNPMMNDLWLSASNEQAVALEIAAWFTHLFRMPLFFIISGVFAHLLIERRGVKQFIVNRLKRIFLPFMIFLPLIMISTLAIIGWALDAFSDLSPMMEFIKKMQGNPEAPKPTFSTMHLWFLFNLMLFCLVAAGMGKYKLLSGKWFDRVAKPKVLIFVVPALLMPALLSVPMPHPAPERIYPELWSFGFNGIFFLIGIVLYKNRQLIDGIKNYLWFMVIASILGYSIFYHALPKSITIEQVVKAMSSNELNWQRLSLAAIEAYVAVWMSLACLVMGKRLLNTSNKVLRYIADSSYWVYILHLPVLFFIQFQLFKVEWGAWIEFGISSFLTLTICIITYALFVRSTPIGYLLNGKRFPIGSTSRPKKIGSHEHHLGQIA